MAFDKIQQGGIPMKKLSLFLALVMMMTMFSFGAVAEEAAGLPELNTTDDITITFLTWDDYELTEALAAKFTELHPNIKIEVIRTLTGDCTATLTNMAAEGNLPDVYFWLDLDPLLTNNMMLDITQYVEADPDYKSLFTSLQRVGYVDGKRCYFMAGENLPGVVFLDKAVFEKLNVEMPAQDWTWEEMTDLIENTLTDASQGIWSYNYYMGPITRGPIALTDNAIGEFGWDGEKYNFGSGWVECAEFDGEMRRLGKQAIEHSEEYIAVVPDDMWPGESGHVAIQMDAFWTLNNIYVKEPALNRGLKMVPYNNPLGAETTNAGRFSFIDFVCISANTEHPREAYEVAKFLTWGKEGWKERIKLYPELVNEAGQKLYEVPGSLPMIDDEEIKEGMLSIMPALKDASGEVYWDDWKGFLDNCTNPVTFGGRAIPGFNSFVANFYHGSPYGEYTGIEAAIFAEAIDPYDYTDALDEAGRKYYDDTLARFFEVYGQAE